MRMGVVYRNIEKKGEHQVKSRRREPVVIDWLLFSYIVAVNRGGGGGGEAAAVGCTLFSDMDFLGSIDCCSCCCCCCCCCCCSASSSSSS